MENIECYYKLKARTSIANKETGEIEFKAVERMFKDKDLLAARKDVFRFRNEFIYGILIDIGLSDDYIGWDASSREFKNLTDREIRKLLNPYLENDSNSGKTKIRYSNEVEDEILWETPNDTLAWYESYNNGIWIIFVHNDEELHWDETEIVIDKVVKYQDNLPIPPLYMNLQEEFEFYKKYNIYCRDYKTRIQFFDDESFMAGGESEIEALKSVFILRTPFDWSGYDKPYWWRSSSQGSYENSPTKPQLSITMEEALGKGECEFAEFKPVLVNNPNFDRDIEYEIARTICAFLNSEGGYLYIGVNDKGEPSRYEIDLKSKDQFLRDFTRIKAYYLPPFIAHTIYGDFYTLKSKTIFIITVFPSIEYPIFLRKKDPDGKVRKEFFIRSDAGSRHLYDIEEVVKYCFKKWH